MLLGQIVDQLLNEHGFADTCAAEQASLATANIGFKQVNGLDARFKDFCLRCQLIKGWSRVVNRVVLHVIRHWLAINRLPHYVPNATERRCSDRHHHGMPCISNAQATLQSIS